MNGFDAIERFGSLGEGPDSPPRGDDGRWDARMVAKPSGSLPGARQGRSRQRDSRSSHPRPLNYLSRGREKYARLRLGLDSQTFS